MSDMSSAPKASVSISENAVNRLKTLMAEDGRPDLKLRVTVSGGGCSGFQYGFDFDQAVQDDDLIIERDDVRVLIDSMSHDFLQGSEIDFVEDLIGSAFRVQNPNASASCGCGTSFAI